MPLTASLNISVLGGASSLNAAGSSAVPFTPSQPARSAPSAANANPQQAFAPSKEWLPGLLRKLELLPEHEIGKALEFHERYSPKSCFGTTLIHLELIDAPTITTLVSEHYGYPLIDLAKLPPRIMTPAIFDVLNEDACKRLGCIAWIPAAGELHAAVASPSAQLHLELRTAANLRRCSKIVVHITTDSAIRSVVREFSGTSRLDADAQTPLFREVDSIFKEAIENGASDIHFEPGPEYLRVRYRVDGKPYTARTYPKESPNWPINKKTVSQQVQIYLKLDVGDGTVPEDCEHEKIVCGRVYRFRVSLLPATHGRSIVVRILDSEGEATSFEKLGMDEDHAELLCQAARQKGKMVLAVAPTGNGKSTTLHALVVRAGAVANKILTIEDPPEYRLALAQQVGVSDKVSFAAAITAAMRQNPDIIMVGEIRDKKTADVATTASLTGHSVYSTVHGDDALVGIARMFDWGIDASVIADRVCLLIAQRLVRRLCVKCREPHPAAAKIIKAHELPTDATLYQPRAGGCPECTDGYRGRIGIFEFVPVDEGLADIIMSDTAGQFLRVGREYARRRCYRTMRQDGFRKAIRGITTIDEVLAHTSKMEDHVQSTAEDVPQC